MHAIDVRNKRIYEGGESAHSAMFGHHPDLTAMYPFYCHVGALDNVREGGRFAPKGQPMRYLGAALDHGVGAIRVLKRRRPHQQRHARLRLRHLIKEQRAHVAFIRGHAAGEQGIEVLKGRNDPARLTQHPGQGETY